MKLYGWISSPVELLEFFGIRYFTWNTVTSVRNRKGEVVIAISKLTQGNV